GWVAGAGAGSATVTITDADTAEASIWFGGSPDTLYRVLAPRNAGHVDVKLSVSRRAKTAFSVDTVVVTGEGTASEGTHFEIPDKTVTFNPGGGSQGSLRVNIINEADSEGKTIVLSIVDPSANTDLSRHYTLDPANPKATITITGPATNTRGPGGPGGPGGPTGGPGTPTTPDPDDGDTDPDPDPDDPDPDTDEPDPDTDDGDPDPEEGDGDGTEQPTGFSDVDPDNTHAAAIAAIYAANITTGCGTNPLRYCPNNPVTRAQMASFLTRALNLNTDEEAGFADVDDTNSHAAAINALAEAGITAGCNTNPLRYCPNQPVTRAQMASFLTRAFKLPAADTADFTDVDPNNSHAAAINALAEAGITTGCSQNPLRYCPNQPVTRAQMASFLTRALETKTETT
ncbi:MAG: S-layer homology domain-containing protein, partial [Acidimicrobiia bacterium]|nr:S-layer homology domain-containing protein [Acidimicrobiia bacterium]